MREAKDALRRGFEKLPLLLALAPALTAGALWCGLAGWACAALGATPSATTEPASSTETQAVVATATAFLNMLSADQRTKVSFSFTPQKTGTVARFARSAPGDPVHEISSAEADRFAGGPPRPPRGPHPGDGAGSQHGPPGGPGIGPPGKPGMGPPGGFTGERYGQAVWSNFPVSDVPRSGLQVGSLTTAQRAAAMHLLQAVLSPHGYQKVLDIMASDQALADSGTPFASGEDVYTIGIFGTPSTTTPWMIDVGGHHLGLNVVIAGPNGVMTPTLTGAQPAVFTASGRTVRVLAGENDKAFALLDALDAAQRKQAILTYRVGDLVFGPDHPTETIVPEGLKGSAMTTEQRAMLLDVIAEWAGIIDETYAKPRLDEIKAGLDDTWFAWSGPTTHEPGQNGSAYYRIQGPKLVIEFAPQDTNGDSTLHVHTIYRDPTNDYGSAFTRP